jgi:nucleotide-binding universal stress UspA family protein
VKIVVGFIDTPEGHAAVEAAIAEARIRDGSLVVVNSMHGGSRESEEQYRATSEAFAALQARLDREGVPYETHEYVRGNSPSEDIMQAVSASGAGMIVIGIRSRSATGKLLLGSNALEILRETSVPVLCVKAGRPA